MTVEVTFALPIRPVLYMYHYNDLITISRNENYPISKRRLSEKLLYWLGIRVFLNIPGQEVNYKKKEEKIEVDITYTQGESIYWLVVSINSLCMISD